jgi:geranylgeranyl diphosphate synthase type II
LEVFHNFTLLHDDVMDNAETRRGRQCVHRKWNTSTAILSGDVMLIEAYRLLEDIEPKHLPAVHHLFTRMAREICEGQQYDMDFERKEVTMDEYMHMIRLKTAVLFANALQIGALLSDAPTNAQNALYEYGIHLGLAFQIEDDYLDCFGNPATFGKAIGGDIREGKKTWMRVTALSSGMLNPDSRDVEYVLSEYRRLGVDEKAKAEISRLTAEALKHLKHLPQNDATTQLRDLAERLVKRNI